MMTRPKVFDDIDLSVFSPKDDGNAPAVPADTVRAVAVESGFASRLPVVSSTATARRPLVYRTGRTATFSVKTTPIAVDAFYSIARDQGWKAGETFEHAVQALTESPVGPPRNGKHAVQAWVDPSDWTALQRLAADDRTSMQTLMLEALEILLERRRSGVKQ
jgi:hypothetical protein